MGEATVPIAATPKLLSFHNDPAIKEKYLQRVRDHAAADEIVQGRYWENGKGCAVGCTIHGRDHGQYEIELGIPEALARIQDMIHEGLPAVEAKTWPLEFLEAVPVGADLFPAIGQFQLFVQRGNLARVEGLALDEALKAKVADAIRRVITLYESAAVRPVAVRSASAALSAAESAAWALSAAESAAWALSAAESARSAARSASRSAAWSAAESAWSARSGASAAWSAAWSAAESTRLASQSAAEAESAARSAVWQGFRAELVRLLRAAG